MTADETKTLLDGIIAEINQLGTWGQAFAPQYAAFIAIGMAMDKQIPGLVAGVQNWVEGNLPTDAEKADLAGKLAVLNDPNAP